MAYLIITIGGEESARRELSTPTVVGRAPDCDISAHDILLSRKHCRFEPAGDGWALADLASKNGTLIGTEKVRRQVLKDGDVIRAGKTRITFRTGSLIPSPTRFARPKEPLAADPSEALAGTVSGFEYVEPPPPPTLAAMLLPTPRPRPRDPVSFSNDSIYSMLEEIASSSWDSIYEVNARPLRPERSLPRPMIRGPHTTMQINARPRRPELNFALQATLPPLSSALPAPPLTNHRVIEGQSAMSRIARRAKVRFARMSRWVARGSYVRFF